MFFSTKCFYFYFLKSKWMFLNAQESTDREPSSHRSHTHRNCWAVKIRAPIHCGNCPSSLTNSGIAQCWAAALQYISWPFQEGPDQYGQYRVAAPGPGFQTHPAAYSSAEVNWHFQPNSVFNSRHLTCNRGLLAQFVPRYSITAVTEPSASLCVSVSACLSQSVCVCQGHICIGEWASHVAAKQMYSSREQVLYPCLSVFLSHTHTHIDTHTHPAWLACSRPVGRAHAAARTLVLVWWRWREGPGVMPGQTKGAQSSEPPASHLLLLLPNPPSLCLDVRDGGGMFRTPTFLRGLCEFVCLSSCCRQRWTEALGENLTKDDGPREKNLFDAKGQNLSGQTSNKFLCIFVTDCCHRNIWHDFKLVFDRFSSCIKKWSMWVKCRMRKWKIQGSDCI